MPYILMSYILTKLSGVGSSFKSRVILKFDGWHPYYPQRQPEFVLNLISNLYSGYFQVSFLLRAYDGVVL